jgi:hypothetical protein
MTLMSLMVRVQTERVLVNWSVEGGCGPFSGTVTAAVQGGASYQVSTIAALAGSVSDAPPRCAGTVSYRVTVADASGATVTGNSSVSVDRDC